MGKIGESQDEKIVDSAGAGEQSDDQIPVATIRLVPTSPIPKTLALRSPGLNASSPRYGPTALWDGHEAYVKLGRLATLSSHRGQGLAKLLVEAALKWAGENGTVLREDERGGNGWNGLVLVHAQVAVEKFWAGLGFVTDEELGRWWEEDIEHLGMWKRVDLQ